MTDYRVFIQAWIEEPNMDAVCKRLGMDRRRASNIAAAIRRNGIALPKRSSARAQHGRGRARFVDWEALRIWASIITSAVVAKRYRQGA